MARAQSELKIDYIKSIFPVITPLLENDAVTEIMIVTTAAHAVLIFYEKAGRLFQIEAQRVTLRDVERFCMMVARPLDIDPDVQPLVDARLADGSRVAFCTTPATPYPAMTIRRFGKTQFKAADLVRMGSLPQPVLDILTHALQSRGNVLVAGGTGSGKTTLLNALITVFPLDHRLLVVEDTLELQIAQPNCVRLEARVLSDASLKLTIRDMVRHALRHRPDHIVIGELRGAEAVDALQALNTGHGGSLTTIHANSAIDALLRVASCALQASDAPPWDNLCLSVSSAFQYVVHQSRLPDGSRGVVELLAVDGYDPPTATWRTRSVWNRPDPHSAEADERPPPPPRAALIPVVGPPLVAPPGGGPLVALDPADPASLPPPPRLGMPSAFLVETWPRRHVARVADLSWGSFVLPSEPPDRISVSDPLAREVLEAAVPELVAPVVFGRPAVRSPEPAAPVVEP